MQTLDRIGDKIGTFPGVPECPPAGATSYVIAADMDAGQAHDTTNWVDLAIEVQSAGQWFEVARWGRANAQPSGWNGGPGKTAPTLTYAFPARSDGVVQAPARIRGVLLNGTKGAGSPAVVGLKTSFGG